MDPVFKEEAGWFFRDAMGAGHGPYASEEEAQKEWAKQPDAQPAQNPDIQQKEDGTWWHSDETGTAAHGPFLTEQLAEEALADYSHWLQWGSARPRLFIRLDEKSEETTVLGVYTQLGTRVAGAVATTVLGGKQQIEQQHENFKLLYPRGYVLIDETGVTI